jgi:nickel-type superoxide dismutase maturation protease
MRARGLIWSLLGLIAVAAVRRWLDVVEVRGTSMSPSLVPGDRLLVARTSRSSRVGEVVVARDPRDPRRELIKRVGSVTSAGVSLTGDNPAASTDARTFGPVAADAVRWRVVARYWPPGRIGAIPPSVEDDLDGQRAGRPPAERMAL